MNQDHKKTVGDWRIPRLFVNGMRSKADQLAEGRVRLRRRVMIRQPRPALKIRKADPGSGIGAHSQPLTETRK
jgi:hypothetical protein